MKKDIEWLKNEILGLSIKARHKENNQREWHMGHEMALFDVNKLINQLDEPETLSEEWIENHTASADTISYYSEEDVPVVTVEKLKNLLVPKQDDGFVVFEKDKLDEEVQRMIDETCEATNEKPIIPQFVDDWINAHNLHGNNPLREYVDLESDFNEGWTNEKDASVYHWVNKNPYAFIDALRYGYEVEIEKLYRVRAGNRYVRFNLDGSIIGVKKDNSIVCLERLSKLPFDYKKAVESGIIILEEVTE